MWGLTADQQLQIHAAWSPPGARRGAWVIGGNASDVAPQAYLGGERSQNALSCQTAHVVRQGSWYLGLDPSSRTAYGGVMRQTKGCHTLLSARGFSTGRDLYFGTPIFAAVAYFAARPLICRHLDVNVDADVNVDVQKLALAG